MQNKTGNFSRDMETTKPVGLKIGHQKSPNLEHKDQSREATREQLQGSLAQAPPTQTHA